MKCIVCHTPILECKCPYFLERNWISNEEAKNMFPENPYGTQELSDLLNETYFNEEEN